MRTLARVSSVVLEKIRSQLGDRLLPLPLTRSGLAGIGVRHQEEILAAAFEGMDASSCIATIEAVLSERADKAVAPELVWTGPEGASLIARDTSVVLRALFESAEVRIPEPLERLFRNDLSTCSEST